MKVLITGSREGISKKEVYKSLNKHRVDMELLINGGAKGVDAYANEWAIENGIPTKVVRPINESNKIDYLFRNCIMIGMSDKVIALWDGKSKGTKFTWDYACHYGLLGELIEIS